MNTSISFVLLCFLFGSCTFLPNAPDEIVEVVTVRSGKEFCTVHNEPFVEQSGYFCYEGEGLMSGTPSEEYAYASRFFPNSLLSVSESASKNQNDVFTAPCSVSYCASCEQEIHKLVKEYRNYKVPLF